MSIRLYFDVHVPRPITDTLRGRGVDVLTSQEDGTRTFADEMLLDRAGELGRVLFTHDTDFLRETTRRSELAIAFAGVIFAAQSAANQSRYRRSRTDRESH